jgi:phosphoglycolate phosphatase
VGHVSRLIAFDLDGTLIDSRQDLADSANALIVERGGSPLPADAIALMVGEGAATLVRRALTAAALPVDEASVPRFLALYDERLLCHTRPYPGIVQTLKHLADVAHLAVLTNKPLGPTQTLLEELDLAPFFGAMVGGDGPLPRKPNPSSLQNLMTTYGSSEADTVLVGDSHIDYQTARNAGTHVCLAAYGFGFQAFPPGQRHNNAAVAREPADIPELVHQLTTRHRA